MKEIDLLEYTLVIKQIASQFPRHYHNDLINEGYLSIIEANKRYNPEIGEFLPYARKWIYYIMLKFISVDRLTNSLVILAPRTPEGGTHFHKAAFLNKLGIWKFG
jgi:hypothetical protein